jgi:hypothetical protein
MNICKFAAVMCAIGIILASGPARAELPAGFVYLSDVDTGIVQDMRYAGSHNFVGRPIAGYQAAECILTQATARALAKAQAQLSAQELSLMVWDCYRPKRAVADFRLEQDRGRHPHEGRVLSRHRQVAILCARIHRRTLRPFARQHRRHRHRPEKRHGTAHLRSSSTAALMHWTKGQAVRRRCDRLRHRL